MDTIIHSVRIADWDPSRELNESFRKGRMARSRSENKRTGFGDKEAFNMIEDRHHLSDPDFKLELCPHLGPHSWTVALYRTRPSTQN